jgi:hypothetical protein
VEKGHWNPSSVGADPASEIRPRREQKSCVQVWAGCSVQNCSPFSVVFVNRFRQSGAIPFSRYQKSNQASQIYLLHRSLILLFTKPQHCRRSNVIIQTQNVQYVSGSTNFMFHLEFHGAQSWETGFLSSRFKTRSGSPLRSIYSVQSNVSVDSRIF